MKLEQGREQFTLCQVDSLRGVQKTWIHSESAPLEVSLIPESEPETLLPADHDRSVL